MTLLELLDLMKKRIKLVIGLPIVCALLIGVYSFMFMPDTYTATTSMYVLTNQEQSAGNLSTDLSASQMVANDVTTLLNSALRHALHLPGGHAVGHHLGHSGDDRAFHTREPLDEVLGEVAAARSFGTLRSMVPMLVTSLRSR